jgi:hypothetical protein
MLLESFMTVNSIIIGGFILITTTRPTTFASGRR